MRAMRQSESHAIPFKSCEQEQLTNAGSYQRTQHGCKTRPWCGYQRTSMAADASSSLSSSSKKSEARHTTIN
eukprot:3177331-Amphidinium_carterae.2